MSLTIKLVPAVKFTPSGTKVPTAQNYIDYSDMVYSKPEVPFHISNTLVDRYGDQTLDHWMEANGLKMRYDSDAIAWMEENRLTQLITGATRVGSVFTFVGHTVRANEVLTAWNPDGTILHKGVVASTTATTFTVDCGTDPLGVWTGLATSGIVCVSGMGDFKKGSLGMQEGLNTTYETFTAKGASIKEMISENRTNLTQKVWLKSKDVKGDLFTWYDVNTAQCEKRFRNKREAAHFDMQEWEGAALTAGYEGREGMLEAMEGGNVASGFISTVADLQSVVRRLEKQGQIRNNYINGNTDFCFEFDTMCASTNINVQSYGVFEQENNRNLNLSFQGASLGGYNFNVGGINYLNSATGHGARVGVTKVNAFLIPSTSSTMKDPTSGKSASRPVLHSMYRAMGSLNRDYEMVIRTWEDGTSLTDTRTTEFQSEQATVLMSRNNTMKFVGA